MHYADCKKLSSHISTKRVYSNMKRKVCLTSRISSIYIIHPSNLGSADDPPKIRLKTYGDRSFSSAGVREWNKLPQDILLAESVPAVKN